MGYDVDASATRLANYFHVLRELVHLSAGHLALEPRFEVKALIADHVHDDARAATNVRRRIEELGGEPGAPGDALAQLLDRANTPDTPRYLEIAYGELKPALIAALHTHQEHVDPLLDEPTMRIVTQLLHRQERHATELPAAHEERTHDDIGALATQPGARTLRPLPRLEQPARDAFVEIGENSYGGDPVHDLMNAALCDAELVARTSHEHPEMPWEFHVDMARVAWDRVRHAEVLDRLMATERSCHWGDHPVGLDAFKQNYARDLAGRLAASRRTERRDPHEVFDYLRADEDAHARILTRWTQETTLPPRSSTPFGA